MRLIRQRDIGGRIIFEPVIGEKCDNAERLSQNILVFNPLTGEPYIPGSYLKERLEILLKKRLEKEPGETRKKFYQLLFGSCENDSVKENAPWRLIIRDALLDEKCLEHGERPVFSMMSAKGEKGRQDRQEALLKNRIFFLQQKLFFWLHIGVRIYEDVISEESGMLDYVLYGLELLEKEGFSPCLELHLENMDIDGASICLLQC